MSTVFREDGSTQSLSGNHVLSLDKTAVSQKGDELAFKKIKQLFIEMFQIYMLYPHYFMYRMHDFICINKKIWGVYEDDLCIQ